MENDTYILQIHPANRNKQPELAVVLAYSNFFLHLLHHILISLPFRDLL